MTYSQAVDSRILLTRLRATLAEPGDGQERLDRIVRLVSDGLAAEVCSVYLRRDDVLELSSTEGLNPGSVHITRLKVGQGLVGVIAETAEPINTRDAARTRGFRYLPETGEEIFSSFLGVPIQRLGEVLGVLVVQNREPREYTDDEVYALEVVAMVIAEMAELGAFVGPGAMEGARPHRLPFFVRGLVGQEGVAEGTVVLHEPQIVVSDPITDDPDRERLRLHSGIEALRAEVDEMLAADYLTASGEHRDVLNAYRMFAYDKGWVRRMEASIDTGLAAEVAVEKEQSATRTRMSRSSDPYLRERLHDLDDLSNRLLRLLAGDERNGRELPPDAILVARNIGPGELLDYGRKLRGVVLEEGSVGSHAAIVARALAIPLVIHAARITREAMSGDKILVDGDQGLVHLRPEETVAKAFRE
jgi:phosphotransferase system enzyme I (PtsP)